MVSILPALREVRKDLAGLLERRTVDRICRELNHTWREGNGDAASGKETGTQLVFCSRPVTGSSSCRVVPAAGGLPGGPCAPAPGGPPCAPPTLRCPAADLAAGWGRKRGGTETGTETGTQLNAIKIMVKQHKLFYHKDL